MEKPSQIWRVSPGRFSWEALSPVIIFSIFTAIYLSTRSPWLDDWDSVQFALGLDEFDLVKHQPHPPGYPVYIAIGKLFHLVFADHAQALTILSALAASTSAMLFYLISRREMGYWESLTATIVLSISPLFWLQSGMALTDMVGFLFVLLFVYTEGISPDTRRGQWLRMVALGLIAGISLGARPHVIVIILAFWVFRSYCRVRQKAGCSVLISVAAFFLGILVWLLPTAFVIGGVNNYFSSGYGQFVASDRAVHVDVLSKMEMTDFLVRWARTFEWIGSTFGPINTRTIGSVLAVILPYLVLSWLSPNPKTARAFIIATILYVLMLFAVLPPENQRYYLPLACLVGWAAAGIISLFRTRIYLLIPSLAAIFLLNLVPSLMLVPQLRESPPVQAINWLNGVSPAGVVYGTTLLRHADYYPTKWIIKSSVSEPGHCNRFIQDIEEGIQVMSVRANYCELKGQFLKEFKRDRRVHWKHHHIQIYQYRAVN